MHELGVVFKVVDTLEQVAKDNNIGKIDGATLSLGEVSMVVPDLFMDCWNWAKKKHDVLAECEMKIETIPAITYCEDCKETYPTVQYGKICPHCGSEHTYLLQGNEFIIKEVEVMDEASSDAD